MTSFALANITTWLGNRRFIPGSDVVKEGDVLQRVFFRDDDFLNERPKRVYVGVERNQVSKILESAKEEGIQDVVLCTTKDMYVNRRKWEVQFGLETLELFDVASCRRDFTGDEICSKTRILTDEEASEVEKKYGSRKHFEVRKMGDALIRTLGARPSNVLYILKKRAGGVPPTVAYAVVVEDCVV